MVGHHFGAAHDRCGVVWLWRGGRVSRLGCVLWPSRFLRSLRLFGNDRPRRCFFLRLRWGFTVHSSGDALSFGNKCVPVSNAPLFSTFVLTVYLLVARP